MLPRRNAAYIALAALHGTLATSSALTLAKGATHMMFLAKAKLILATTLAIVLLATATGTVVRYTIAQSTAPGDSVGRIPSAAELLARNKEATQCMAAVSMKIETEGHRDSATSPPINRCTVRFFRQGDRVAWRGGQVAIGEDGKPNGSTNSLVHFVFDGKRVLKVQGQEPEYGKIYQGEIHTNYDKLLTLYNNHPSTGEFLDGRMFGNSGQSVVTLLEKSAELQVEANQENVGKIPCFVVQANTRYGKVKAWFAPDKGYSLLKWSIRKEGQDLFDDRTTEYRPGEYSYWVAEMDFQQVQNHFVAVSGMLTQQTKEAEKSLETVVYTTRRSEIQFSPNFEEMGAFRFDIPDGTRLVLADVKGIWYEWRDGKIIPKVDKNAQENMTQETLDRLVDEFQDLTEKNHNAVAPTPSATTQGDRPPPTKSAP